MKFILTAVAALLIAAGCTSFHPADADAIAAQSYFHKYMNKKMAIGIMQEYLARAINDPKMGRELRDLTLDETGFEATFIANDPAVNNFGVTLKRRAHWDSLSELKVEESGFGATRVIRTLAIYMAPDMFTLVSQSNPGQPPLYQANLICAMRVLAGTKEPRSKGARPQRRTEKGRKSAKRKEGESS